MFFLVTNALYPPQIEESHHPSEHLTGFLCSPPVQLMARQSPTHLKEGV